jgi:multidrug efflux system membrane fusion protein
MAMSNTRRTFIVVTALLAVGSGIAGAAAMTGYGSVVLDTVVEMSGLRSPVLAADTAGAAKKPALRSVRVIRPEPAPGTSTLTLSGRTAPAEQALVSSRASGIVAERHVDIGDRVKSGDVLVMIDAPEVAQELLRARASVDQANARLELARVNLQRAENLVGQGHVSVQTVDERRANQMTAEADLAAAHADVKRLEEVSSFQTVRAPFAGTIVARQVERGDKVSADSSQQGSYLLRIARLDELKVEIDVPQSSSMLVKTGAQAHVTFAELPGEKLSARVVRTAGLIEQASNTMRAELLMPNPDARVPGGLNGQVVIDIPQGTGSVTVPTNTLVTREGRQMVALADAQSRVVLKAVSVARDLGERVVIVAGLTVDDRVIVSPNALLRPGDEVEITTPTARNTAGK